MKGILGITRENWFLVVPTIVLGMVASYTLYRMHAAGDVRRAVEIVVEYEAEGKPPLGEFLALRGPLACDSEVVSSFYGTMDVSCTIGAPGSSGAPATDSPELVYTWRVHVMQKSFAPADEPTRALMSEYQPSLFGDAGS